MITPQSDVFGQNSHLYEQAFQEEVAVAPKNTSPIGSPLILAVPNKITLWSLQDDRELTALVEKYGEKNWKKIGSELTHKRSDQQCRRHWAIHLRPGLSNLPWTRAEQLIIIQLAKEGKFEKHQWEQCARTHFPNRSGESLRRQYNSMQSTFKRKMITRELEEINKKSKIAAPMPVVEPLQAQPMETSNPMAISELISYPIPAPAPDSTEQKSDIIPTLLPVLPPPMDVSFILESKNEAPQNLYKQPPPPIPYDLPEEEMSQLEDVVKRMEQSWQELIGEPFTLSSPHSTPPLPPISTPFIQDSRNEVPQNSSKPLPPPIDKELTLPEIILLESCVKRMEQRWQESEEGCVIS